MLDNLIWQILFQKKTIAVLVKVICQFCGMKCYGEAEMITHVNQKHRGLFSKHSKSRVAICTSLCMGWEHPWLYRLYRVCHGFRLTNRDDNYFLTLLRQATLLRLQGQWWKSENWLKHKTKPQLQSLTKLSLSKSLTHSLVSKVSSSKRYHIEILILFGKSEKCWFAIHFLISDCSYM